MNDKRKHKLLLISPTGHEYQVGFLSPCRDGFVLGTSQIEQIDSSHLTILSRKGKLSAHITAQKTPQERQYFLPTSIKKVAARFHSLIENRMVFRLSSQQLSEEVVYVTVKMEDWFDALMSALYRKKTSEKEVVHTLDFKRLIGRLPGLISELKESPQTFFGLCKAKDMLKDSSIIAGFSSSKVLIIRMENDLIGVDLGVFTALDLAPSINHSEISDPLTEICQSMGIRQYFSYVQKTGFMEKLLFKESSHSVALSKEMNHKANQE